MSTDKRHVADCRGRDEAFHSKAVEDACPSLLQTFLLTERILLLFAQLNSEFEIVCLRPGAALRRGRQNAIR
ncbi:hypothetical protein D3C73_676140 [compost metagenome]